MNNSSSRIDGYDLIRSTMIFIVFIAHILQIQGSDFAKLVVLSLSPGLTMSLLGFISGALLGRRASDTGAFLIRRLMRIYLTLIPCICLILFIHVLIGKVSVESFFQQGERIFIKHIFIHMLGLSAFIQMLLVENRSTIGEGLWFITVIVALYFALPILQSIFIHKNGIIHMIVLTVIGAIIHLTGLGVSSASNVVTAFSLGVYLSVNNKMSYLTKNGSARHFFYSSALLAIVVMARSKLIHGSIEVFLYVFYPFAFVPLFFYISKKLPVPLIKASSYFSGLSFEFYILHFYFINKNYQDFFPGSSSLVTHIILSFIISLALAFVMSKCSSFLNKIAEKYFFYNKHQVILGEVSETYCK